MMKKWLKIPLLLLGLTFGLSACLRTSQPAADSGRYAEYELVTLLPRDAIPAIDDPQFLTAVEADEQYNPEELILGVAINDEARAYSLPLLSNREIVNDTVGGVKIAVTW